MNEREIEPGQKDMCRRIRYEKVAIGQVARRGGAKEILLFWVSRVEKGAVPVSADWLVASAGNGRGWGVDQWGGGRGVEMSEWKKEKGGIPSRAPAAERARRAEETKRASPAAQGIIRVLGVLARA